MYSEADHLMTAGIYSTDTLKQFQKKLMFPVEKPAIMHTIGATMAGYEVATQKLDALQLLKSASLEELQNNYIEKIYGWSFNVSLHVGALTGFVVILFVLKNIGDMLINGAFLYQSFGFSVRLLASVWGTLAKHLLIKLHAKVET
jgi:carbon starvation protein CstA